MTTPRTDYEYIKASILIIMRAISVRQTNSATTEEFRANVNANTNMNAAYNNIDLASGLVIAAASEPSQEAKS